MFRLANLLIFLTLSWQVVSAEETQYIAEIKPLLAEKCYSCHGALKQESGLRLETKTLMLQGGDSGSVLNLEDHASSLMIERIQSDGSDRMPPEGEGAALTKDQIAQVISWIKNGAEAPDEKTPLGPADHWAFQPVKSPRHRPDQDRSNPIDAFLAEKHEGFGIEPQELAIKTIQIRRLYLDLIGLPPTAEQLSDPRPFEAIVDELLDSPQHGERWARQWMDVWRYSDWYGLGEQLRNSQKHLWHWRDWIIESLNADKGYDQMIREMLAGDELSPTDPAALAATGFLARNYYLFNRTTWLDSTIEHTSKAFLGLTMNCAKCHDHKYDPISHIDYYRMRAIFEPHQVRLDPIPGVTDLEKDGLPRVFDDKPDATTFLHKRGDPSNPDKDTVIQPGVPSIFSDTQHPIRRVSLPSYAFAPGTRPHVLQDQLTRLESEIRTAEKELQLATKEFEAYKKSKTEQPTQDSNSSSETFKLSESFDSLDTERWELIGGNWKIHDGMLHQTEPTREQHFARLKQAIPRNFEVNCFYTHTGGTIYRSVTFRFDESADNQNRNFVYTSAHAPGPKIQVATTLKGQSDYPIEGRKSQTIEEGKRYHLRFAIRDRLINVWLDGELMVAYQFPARFDGTFSLSGFDSTVAFDELTIQSLADEVALTESKNPSTAVDDVEAKQRIAEANLEKIKREKDSIEATILADLATYKQSTHDTQQDDPSLAAAQTTSKETHAARLRAAKSQQELLIAEAKLRQAQTGKNESANIEKARKLIETLQTSSDSSAQYKSFKVTRKALESPAHKDADYPATYSTQSSGRRSAFANWIASKNNPLTARVAVNQVWMRHFGNPLVESVFDFGLRAKAPIHQELLDALAFEFMQSGWSFKYLHRLIVTSEVYRRRSSNLHAHTETLTKDPENRLYWRMNARRMESQLLRDSLLALSGQIDLTLGGPSLDHNPTSRRRSLYLKHSPDIKDQFLETFDNANVLACYRRSESIVPQQALAMVNSKLSLSCAGEIKNRFKKENEETTDKRFIEVAFERLLARHATSEELEICTNFLRQIDSQTNTESTEESESSWFARERLVHAILNHHEFITIR